jgi:Recombination endonuclease VII
MRTCKKCGVEKPQDQFSLRGTRLRGECLACELAYRKAHYKENSGRLRAASKKWREEHPEQTAARKRLWNSNNREQVNASKRKWHARNRERQKHYLRQLVYGISPERYQEFLLVQGDVCAICGGRNQTGKDLAVDHSHLTGKVRGLLCNRCNILLGLAKDDPERLLEAALYLESRGS